ncbi:hypothetical protein GCM10022281_01690 [Sphingomonas rosea]|jgi:Flp pilus assembly protein TadG|uniref:TadE-like domain-containing protein n=1 Tax=Sphingomonas rosea TaxID=335605 RepID=A0ABP7TI71_9SPHN
MNLLRKLRRDEGAATVIEFAVALPTLVVMLFMIYQMGLLFRANSGIQHALGQGARQATLWPTPSTTTIKQKMQDSVYGIGPGTFTISEPDVKYDDTAKATYWDLTVTYTQATSLIVYPGPNVTITKSKRVWVAS